MNRIEDWPTVLFNFVESRRHMPFAWGTNDCATFATEAVAAITGETLFTPPYDDALSAARYIEESGGIETLATALLGEPSAPLSLSRGDVALLLLDGRETLAICVGDRFVAPGEEQIFLYPHSLVLKGWKV